MGVTNLCQLLKLFQTPYKIPEVFDSLLIDAQSYLYGAIDSSLEPEQDGMIQEVCRYVWNQIETILNAILTLKETKVIISFDGEGVPMKWPTQRERRKKKCLFNSKTFYKYVFFGANSITLQVEEYILKCLKIYMLKSKRELHIILCGCKVFGEGEHKIFHIAEKLNCRRPIIVSVDQDVFILALLRLDRYDTIQIYRYREFYNITSLAKSLLPGFVTISNLFGNDFIPPVVGISQINAPFIHKSLEVEENDPPSILFHFLRNISPKLKYSVASYINRELIQYFWMTYLWILDYYTMRQFPQLYMKNQLFDLYDRNQLLTALTDENYSRQVFQEAQNQYRELITQPLSHPEQYIFNDLSILERLKPFWVTLSTQGSFCRILKLTK